MTSGFDIWPSWLKRTFPSLRLKGHSRRDCCDYELPAPRLVPDRLPITRPSSPCPPPAPEPELHRAVPVLNFLSAPRVESKSPLLELLLLEIRQKIWSLVLGVVRSILSCLRIVYAAYTVRRLTKARAREFVDIRFLDGPMMKTETTNPG
ncbi:hypothetical protein BKA64DRAFT_777223 [Cadophora sp. MPI-SDFR-AT-0126]|nr:hypothetical protein BKA64DRAFT_777223 [Leotiomycetes sp. MPI-SDFR-AT-0126]